MAKYPISKDYRHNSQLKAIFPRNQAVPIMSVILTLSHKTPIKPLTQHTSSHSEAYGDRLAPQFTSSPHTHSHSEAYGDRSTPHSRQRISSLIKQVRLVSPQSTSSPHTPSHSEALGVRFTSSRPFYIITPVSHHHTRSTSISPLHVRICVEAPRGWGTMKSRAQVWEDMLTWQVLESWHIQRI